MGVRNPNILLSMEWAVQINWRICRTSSSWTSRSPALMSTNSCTILAFPCLFSSSLWSSKSALLKSCPLKLEPRKNSWTQSRNNIAGHPVNGGFCKNIVLLYQIYQPYYLISQNTRDYCLHIQGWVTCTTHFSLLMFYWIVPESVQDFN